MWIHLTRLLSAIYYSALLVRNNGRRCTPPRMCMVQTNGEFPSPKSWCEVVDIEKSRGHQVCVHVGWRGNACGWHPSLAIFGLPKRQIAGTPDCLRPTGAASGPGASVQVGNTCWSRGQQLRDEFYQHVRKLAWKGCPWTGHAAAPRQRAVRPAPREGVGLWCWQTCLTQPERAPGLGKFCRASGRFDCALEPLCRWQRAAPTASWEDHAWPATGLKSARRLCVTARRWGWSARGRKDGEAAHIGVVSYEFRIVAKWEALSQPFLQAFATLPQRLPFSIIKCSNWCMSDLHNLLCILLVSCTSP